MKKPTAAPSSIDKGAARFQLADPGRLHTFEPSASVHASASPSR
jgi:hypothetical protein